SMYPLKKYFTEGLIQLTIMLSLLRMDPDTYLMGGPGQQHHHHHHLHDLLLVQGSAHTRPGWDATPGFLGPGLGLGGPGPALHPKNPDAAVLDGFWDMRRLLDEVRSLDRIRAGTTDIAAWLVHSNGGASGSPTSSAGVETEAGGGGGGVGGGGGGDVEVEEARALEERPLAAGAEAMPVGGSELTKEDLDLIEVLWRQDVDLGAERVAFDSLHRQRQAKEERLPGAGGGVDGTHAEAVDGETGEGFPATLPSETFSLDECLQLLEANFPFGEGSEVRPLRSGRQRSCDVRQGWEDVQRLLGQHREEPGFLLCRILLNVSPAAAAASAAVIQELTLNENSSNRAHSAASCELDNEPGSEEIDICLVTSRHSRNFFPLESPDVADVMDMELGAPLGAPLAPRLSSDLSDEALTGLLDPAFLDELSLMDLTDEEAGEMLGATQRTSLCAELDSDSGLSLGSSPRASSPGSSITAGDDEEDDEEEEEEEGAVGYSDGETMDVDSSSDDEDDDDDEEEEEEGAVGGYQPEYRKFCRMDFRNPDSFRATPSLDHVQHNHTYNLQAGVTPAQQQQQQGKPSSAPSPVSASSKDRPSTRLSRDERRARAMKIPFSTEKIINLPVEDFNALLGGHRLSEPQLALVRDIRRRGKNKVAAQNCRKRKLDTLLTLEGELAALRRRKDELLREKLESGRALRGLRLKLGELHAEVLASLRDGRGAGRRPLRPAELLL
uniref:Nuclear factor, erythroid 2-like 1a n=1 Tax=Petromyzon marinus TaxID=7757 RepID=S4RCN8_PETMA